MRVPYQKDWGLDLEIIFVGKVKGGRELPNQVFSPRFGRRILFGKFDTIIERKNVHLQPKFLLICSFDCFNKLEWQMEPCNFKFLLKKQLREISNMAFQNLFTLDIG